MVKIKVKPEHASKVFGFNNSTKPLGNRDDLHLLIQDAKHHKLQHILDMFEEIPDETNLLEVKEEKFLATKNEASKPNSDKGIK